MPLGDFMPCEKFLTEDETPTLGLQRIWDLQGKAAECP